MNSLELEPVCLEWFIRSERFDNVLVSLISELPCSGPIRVKSKTVQLNLYLLANMARWQPGLIDCCNCMISSSNNHTIDISALPLSMLTFIKILISNLITHTLARNQIRAMTV